MTSVIDVSTQRGDIFVYIIIAGCRKVGSNLAIVLSQSNHDVVVIDSDPDNFELLGSGFNGLTITGMPIDEDVLRSAGIEKADALAAVSSDDNMNVMISQVATNLFHVPKVITRMYDPDRETVFNKLGLITICPTTLAVDKIREYLLSAESHEKHLFHGTGIDFNYIRPGKNLIGKQIKAIENVHAFGLIRNSQFTLGDPDLRIEENDTVILADYTEQGE
jgi:trk system potassium uptake protein TrkA